MQSVDLDFILRATVGMLVITSPFDPVKLLFFNKTVEEQKLSRTAGASRLALYVTVILGVAALVGNELLTALGVDLNAFSAVGGIIIAAMGFEMLYGGGASKAQGESEREQGPEEGDGLMIPLALPLIAGPGAITTAITLSSQNTSWEGLMAMAIAIAAVAVVTFAFYRYFGEVLARLKPATISILARLGGLILASLGFQMFLNGIKNFFA
ncbi:MAG: NAAT family transporter [Actinomycetia bacterium]|nr:NAAT family transporter [Actinomycetes bacterium]